MNICIYGASSSVIAKSYINPTEELGFKLAVRGHAMVFGGGAQGLMGAAARGVSAGGGKIIGIAPSFFDVDGVLYPHCDELIYTDTMSERKQLMEQRSDAFIVTPGGPGTLDEFFEVLTLKQLRRHTKPIAVFNLHGYYNDLKKQLESAVEKLFMSPECLKLFTFTNNPEKLLQYIEMHQAEPSNIAELKYLQTNKNC